MPAEAFQRFARLLAGAKNVAVLTGAGVSAESGVPTFRSGGGLWRKYDPTMLATPQAFARDPATVWEFYHYRREVAGRCRPNAAHYAIAEFERRGARDGKRVSVITQNVDGLHAAAGSKSAVEIHGSVWDVCRASATGHKDGPCWEDRRQPLVPALEGCGDPNGEPADIPEKDLPHDAEGRLLRPGVVWFNENLDEAVADKVESILEDCNLMIIVGTSAVVYPAAGYAPHVAARGVPVVEINLEPTDNSRLCAITFKGKAGLLLPRLLGVQDDESVRSAMAAAAAQEKPGAAIQRLRVH
ncbi:MAG: NAD-dependent deacetylase sirtuin-5 [Monoraphidium minutum]|nr:MAG: NAD-dependent deacetylase sirtuin-5 [Monoraphidium minutum]